MKPTCITIDLEIDPKESDKNGECGLVFAVEVIEKFGALKLHPLLVDVVVTSSNRESFV